MLRYHLKIAFRNFLRNRFFTGLNILGLSVGIAVALLISIFLLHELSYDDFHPEVEKLYRVNQTNIWDPAGGWMARTPPPVADALASEFPEIRSTLRINIPGSAIVNVEKDGDTKAFKEDKVLAADSNFFEFFGFRLKEGDPKSALKQINSVVVSEETAIRYFGDQPALGKIILLGDEKTPVEVTGVTEEQPTNAHFHFDMLLSMSTNPNVKTFEWSWIWTQMYTYVKIDGPTRHIEEGLPSIAHTYALDAFNRLGISMSDFEDQKGKLDFQLQPVQDIYLDSSVGGNMEPLSDMNNIYIFATVALFILLLAGINFVNLTTARAANRAKEIGIKKVIGSDKFNLIRQFLLESVLLSSVATLLGLGLAELLRFAVVDYLDINLDSGILSDSRLVLAVVLLPLILGILAGSYPAFYMTSFQPAKVLKGKIASGAKNSVLRNILVVCQFSIAVILVASTTVIYRQLKFCHNADLGFDRDYVLVVEQAEMLKDQLSSFKNEMDRVRGVKATSITSVLGASTSIALEDLFYKKGQPERKISLATIKGDENYIPLLDMKLLAGRNFSRANPADRSAIIINEKAMKAFGWDLENVIGQKIEYFESIEFSVIGVISDFNMISVKYQIPPIAIFHVDAELFNDNRLMAIKYDPRQLQGVMNGLESNWQSLVESVPLNYVFLDESFASQYAKEKTLGSLFSVFAGLALLIACLGLLGLASFMAVQRNKEIGVRKVMGASVLNIVLLLNGNFSRLIILSVIISIPVVWWGMTEWLDQFVEKISIGWEVYVISGLSALAIAWLTVSYQSVRAAVANPVHSLKEE